MQKQIGTLYYEKFWRNTGRPYSYLTPVLLILLFIVVSPVLMSLILSFYNFTGFDSRIFKSFVGFENFKILFDSRYFWISARNTFYFLAASVTIHLAISLLLAVTIFFGNFKNSTLIRTIIFFPAVLAPVSVSLAWRQILEQNGVINKILHIDFPWTANINTAIWCVIIVSIWQWIGYNMVIFYAGLQSLDKEILEAAEVDGATWWGKIIKIVIPSLYPTIILNLLLNIIGSFRVFDIVYVLTKGGPVHSSEVFSTLMYWYSFAGQGPNKMGVGSSIALIMFFIMIIFGIIRVRLTKDRNA
jgi:ABC-type sugar transport system permease subunit